MHDPNFLRTTCHVLCMVASMPYGIWTCLWWGNRWSPGPFLPRPGPGIQLSSWTVSQWCGVPEVDAGKHNLPQVLNWIQDSINAFIQELLTHSSHMRPAAGRTEAHCTGDSSDSGSSTWETSVAASSCHRKCNTSQEGMKPLLRGCLTSSPVDCLFAESACQIDVLLLPNWTDWFPWSVVDLDLYCDDAVLHLLFVQVIHKHRHVEPSHPEAVAGVLFLTALLLWNSQYYSGLLLCYKYLSICPHLLLTVFCPGASSEPCPERWMRLKASFMADRVR